MDTYEREQIRREIAEAVGSANRRAERAEARLAKSEDAALAALRIEALEGDAIRLSEALAAATAQISVLQRKLSDADEDKRVASLRLRCLVEALE